MFLLFIAMSSTRHAKWQIVNKRVKKHLATLEIETEDNIEIEREIQYHYNQSVKNTVKSEYALDSDVSEYCQEFDERDFLDENCLAETANNCTLNCVRNASDSESCSSIENYFINNITEEDCSSNNNAEFCSNNNTKERDIHILKLDTNLSNNLAQGVIEFKISHSFEFFSTYIT